VYVVASSGGERWANSYFHLSCGESRSQGSDFHVYAEALSRGERKIENFMRVFEMHWFVLLPGCGLAADATICLVDMRFSFPLLALIHGEPWF